MARVQTFRYPQRARLRALEIFYGAGRCPSSQIVKTLEQEGFGEIPRNTVERWLREDPARRAMQVTYVAKRLRREAAAYDGSEDQVDRIKASARQLADIAVVAVNRAAKQMPSMPLDTPSDLERLAATYRDIMSAFVECSRAVHELERTRVFSRDH